MLTANGAAICLSALVFAAGQTQAAAPADLILVHGKILTVDAADSIAAAVAVRDGKIQAVGTDAQVMMFAGSGTQIIDLRGRTATPGLIDSHAHVAQGGYNEVYGVELKNAASVADAVSRVKARIALLKPGEWVRGDGWDEGKLADRRYILATDLDAVSPENPVWLTHTTGHYGVANSYALRLAKITSASINPTAGTIDRDAKGAPTGVLKESAQELVIALIPAPTPAQWRQGILRSIDTMHREGMTAVKDPMIEKPMWDAYRELMDAHLLSVHVCALWRVGATLDSAKKTLEIIQALPKPPRSLGEGNLLSCGAKIFMDGSGGARTAWVYKPWNKSMTDLDAGNYGYPSVAPDVYRQQVQLLHAAGVNIGTHAIGDRAIDWVVDTYAKVLERKPTVGLRHSIIHANLPTDHALEVMAGLQKRYDAGYPEMQPEFIYWIGDTYAANLGVDRSARLIPLKTIQTHGVKWAGGSDYFVTPLPARLGIWAAVERETLKGTYGPHPFGTSESVDVHEALRAYTRVGARQVFLEEKIGSLEVGKDADIAVWDKDMYTIPADELKALKCEMTLFRGRVVYQSE